MHIKTVLQSVTLLLVALVAGSVFGIWRGYNPAAYSAGTFLEVHQGAVRGLNVLLPIMGLGAIILTLVLAWLAYRARNTVAASYYAFTAGAMIVAAVVTRAFNQPINAEVMQWTAAAMPSEWTDLRDTWWRWHLVRTGVTIIAFLFLLCAVFSDRRNAEGPT